MGIPKSEYPISKCPACDRPFYWGVSPVKLLTLALIWYAGLKVLFKYFHPDIWLIAAPIAIVLSLAMTLYPKSEPGVFQKRNMKKWEQEIKEETEGAQYVYPKKIMIYFMILFPFLFGGLSEWIGPYINPYVMSWANKNAHNQGIFTIMLISLPIIATLALAIYFWIMAYKVRRTQTFPPKGLIILARTKILSGEPAVRNCRDLIIMGFYVIGLGGMGLWFFFHTFGHGIMGILHKM